MTDRARLITLCELRCSESITDVELLRRLQPNMLGYLQGYGPDPTARLAVAGGLPASGGQAFGRVVFRGFSRDHGSEMPPILFLTEIVPDDLRDVEDSVAVVTSRGGMTSHAAVICRGMAMPCVAACDELIIDDFKRVIDIGSGLRIQENTPVYMDGVLGRVEFSSSRTLIPRYSVSDQAGEFFEFLKSVLRDVSSREHFESLSLDDQMHVASLKNRLRALNILP